MKKAIFGSRGFVRGTKMTIICKSSGWIPDIPDQRDFLYEAIKPRIKLPGSVDLRQHCSAVEIQGKLGSCTACALSGNLEFIDYREDLQYANVSRL